MLCCGCRCPPSCCEAESNLQVTPGRRALPAWGPSLLGNFRMQWSPWYNTSGPLKAAVWAQGPLGTGWNLDLTLASVCLWWTFSSPSHWTFLSIDRAAIQLSWTSFSYKRISFWQKDVVLSNFLPMSSAIFLYRLQVWQVEFRLLDTLRSFFPISK